MPLTQNLRRDRVRNIERKPALSLPPTATVRQAIALMQSNRTGCVFVEENGELVGIFTERDLVKRVIVRGGDITAIISSVMTPKPATAMVDESIGGAMRKMVQGGYRHLPVVDEHGRTCGRLSVREIVHYMVEHFPTAVYNLPPRPDQPPATQEGA